MGVSHARKPFLGIPSLLREVRVLTYGVQLRAALIFPRSQLIDSLLWFPLRDPEVKG